MNPTSKPRIKIEKFTDLVAWQEGHRLVLTVYRATRSFPAEEQFGLTSQLRRAVVSHTSNIAEGFSRGSYKDKTHFYEMSLGSLTEVQNQCLIARDIGYLSKEKFQEIAGLSVHCHKLTNGLIKSSKTRSRKA